MSDSSSRRPHLAYLDGIRGVSALYVVLAHIWLLFGRSKDAAGLNPLAISASALLSQAHFAVAVFIVLSGYCLMIPVARAGTGYLPKGIPDFIRRRAWRILPPYYAALLLSWLAITVIAPLQQQPGPQYDGSDYAFSPVAVLTHLLLVHNISKHWIWSINAPLWSVAVEWQIYIVFALILLPLCRKFGLKAILAGTIAVTALPYILVRNLHALERSGPWYVALFLMGVYAADVNFNPARPRMAKCKAHSLSILAAILFACLIGVIIAEPAVLAGKNTLNDLLMGCATACYLAATTTLLDLQHEARDRGETPSVPPLQRFLQSRAMVSVGLFSYSLYLTHYLIVDGANNYLQTLHLGPNPRYAVLMVLVFPLCLVFAFGFHLFFEKPFLSFRNRKTVAPLAPPPRRSPILGAAPET